MAKTEQGLEDLLLQKFLELHEMLILTTDAALQDGRFRNLSRNEMRTLQAIGLYHEKTMGDTAQELGITLGTLTVAINRLVKKAYVERHRAEEDQRKVMLSLTREGQIAFRLFRKFNRLLMQRVLRDVPESEQKMLLNLLSNMDIFMRRQFLNYTDREVSDEQT